MTISTRIARRILVFCDGTTQDGLISWEIADDALAKMVTQGSTPIAEYASNVFRLSRSIPPEGTDGTHQIVMYQSGVGVPDNFEANNSHTQAVITGTAVASKIRDVYNFIAQNYLEGDRIYLFGFSRGAYTARKVAGLIDRMGLLEKKEMSHFATYWRNLYTAAPNPGLSPTKTGRDVEIEFLGVWDTVGSILKLGIIEMTDLLGLKDKSLPGCVKRARHAMAYHEERSYFQCTPFEDDSGTDRLLQVWFPGVHRDVGGGYKDHQIADISLLWMAGEAQAAGVELDGVYLGTRLSRAGESIAVHYEGVPPGRKGRREIYQQMLEKWPEKYHARCHRSLWATNFQHFTPERQEYWESPDNRLALTTEHLINLNVVEQKFWEKRWTLTIPDPKAQQKPIGRGAPPAHVRPDLTQVHPAPEEDENLEALFSGIYSLETAAEEAQES